MKKVFTVIFNHSANINRTNNHLSAQTIGYIKDQNRHWKHRLWDRQNNVASLTGLTVLVLQRQCKYKQYIKTCTDSLPFKVTTYKNE